MRETKTIQTPLLLKSSMEGPELVVRKFSRMCRSCQLYCPHIFYLYTHFHSLCHYQFSPLLYCSPKYNLLGRLWWRFRKGFTAIIHFTFYTPHNTVTDVLKFKSGLLSLTAFSSQALPYLPRLSASHVRTWALFWPLWMLSSLQPVSTLGLSSI